MIEILVFYFYFIFISIFVIKTLQASELKILFYMGGRSQEERREDRKGQNRRGGENKRGLDWTWRSINVIG